MSKLWKRGVRSFIAVVITGIFIFAAGCGGGNGDDNNDDHGGSTDTTPNAFSFIAQTGVALNTAITSNPITVTGINSNTQISITGGTYAINGINGGAYTSTDGTVTNGQIVTVRHTSAATNGTGTTTTLTIGGVSAVFTSTTDDDHGGPTDTTPNAFSFTAQTGVAASTAITSNAITVAGINSPAPISITGGTYAINSGAYTAVAGTVTNGQTVTVQHTSSAANSTATTTTLTIGGVSAAFTSTTVALPGVDTTPNAFSFTAQTGVTLNTVVSSNVITVAGINGPAPISITGGTYSINGGAFTSTAGTVTNGQTVTVRHNSSAANSTATTTTLTIGGVSAAFTSTTVVAAQQACGTCHAIPPTTGHHTFHVTSRSIGCATCHGSGYSATTTNAATHNNGVVNVVSSFGWNATTKTCATPGCHGGRTW